MYRDKYAFVGLGRTATQRLVPCDLFIFLPFRLPTGSLSIQSLRVRRNPVTFFLPFSPTYLSFSFTSLVSLFGVIPLRIFVYILGAAFALCLLAWDLYWCDTTFNSCEPAGSTLPSYLRLILLLEPVRLWIGNFDLHIWQHLAIFDIYCHIYLFHSVIFLFSYTKKG